MKEEKKATEKKKHVRHGSARCAYDEYMLDQELRDRAETMGKENAALQKENATLRVNLQRVMTALLADGAALRIYREQYLAQLTSQIEAGAQSENWRAYSVSSWTEVKK